MNIPVEGFLSSGPGILAMGGLVSMWFKNQNHQEILAKEASELKRQQDAIWKWKEAHEKDSYEMREKFNKEIATISGALEVNKEQFRQIIDRLQEIKERMDNFENAH